MNCCNSPNPRISEKTGRMFCANCRSFLDNGPRPSKSDTGHSGATETVKMVVDPPIQISPLMHDPEGDSK